ncbi:hypothetical protein PMIN07_001846 [Paraphaeosphaeria minitans]|uniref:FAD binding domain-containing protein n=1 Tax=Paraphaeosphaeria minitans TaxID=565426 RepID=A0A9P6GC56_9PLEO|nr:FAD binding domain-containing protein [Paraphaeosphaeria minitans]
MLSITTWASALALFGAAYAGPTPPLSNNACSKSLGALGLPASWTKSIPCTGNARLTCSVLQHLFPSNETFTGGSQYYQTLVQVPYSAICEKDPACFVTPETSADVSLIMRVLTATNTKFAIRSWGHLPLPGWNAVGSDGVVISLERLQKKVLSPDKKYAVLGPGQNWATVYDWIEDQGVQVVGGRDPGVGVGGFLLGGGISLFNDKKGLGLDQVVRYEVVLPSGKVVNATTKENADLYKSLKGGLSNFGIVTEFEVITSDIIEINYEVNLYHKNATRAILSAYADFLRQDGPGDAVVQLEVSQNSTLVFYGHIGHVSSAPEFKAFRSIPIMTPFLPPTNGTVASFLFATVGSSGNGANGESPGSYYHASVAQKIPDSKLVLQAYDDYLEAAKMMAPGMSMYFAPQGFTSALVKAGNALNGGNIMGLHDAPQFWHDTYVTFPDVKQYGLAQKAVDSWEAAWTRKAKKEGSFLPIIYSNNGNVRSKPLGGYGRKNFDFIKKTAKKYDPKGVMQTLQNDGFLIRKEA